MPNWIKKALTLLKKGRGIDGDTLRAAQETSSLTRRWLADAKYSENIARPRTILLLTLAIVVFALLEGGTEWFELPQEYKEILFPSFIAAIAGYFGYKLLDKIKK